jgi:hypothetical protein
MSTDRAALNKALRQELRKAAEQGKRQPSWAKRQMPAITASLAKADPRHKK